MRLAIFGGTFNPVHFGHLRNAREVRAFIRADKVLFIPTAEPPHKKTEQLADAKDRLEMLKLATKETPAFEACDIEIIRGGKSYTIDTLIELRRIYPDAKLSLIMGSDSFNDFSTWLDYLEIIKLASLVVLTRPGSPRKKIAEVLPVELALSFCYDLKTGLYTRTDSNGAKISISFVDNTELDISSSAIRAMVSDSKDISSLVPRGVADYIDKTGIYR